MGDKPDAIEQVRFITAVHALGRIAGLTPQDVSKTGAIYEAIKNCRDRAAICNDHDVFKAALDAVERRLKEETQNTPALAPFVHHDIHDIHDRVFDVACTLLSLDATAFTAASTHLKGNYICYRHSTENRLIEECMLVFDEHVPISRFSAEYKTTTGTRIHTQGYILPIQKNYFFAGIMRGRRVPYLHFSVFQEPPEEFGFLHGVSLDTDYRGHVVASKYYCEKIEERKDAPKLAGSVFDRDAFVQMHGEEKLGEILKMIGESALSL